MIHITRPVSHKAGRWGLDGAHAVLLDELGFRVDTAGCPGVNWGPSRGAPRGCGDPDVTTAPLTPYRLSGEDVCCPGALRVWEIPPTIVFDSAVGRHVPGGQALYRKTMRPRRSRRRSTPQRVTRWPASAPAARSSHSR